MEPEKPNETTTTESTHWQTFYSCPFSRRVFNALITVMTILFIYLHGNYEPGDSILAFSLLGGVIGVALFAIIFDPHTTFRSTRRIEIEGGEKGEGDKGKGGKVVIVQRPLVGFGWCKTQVEAQDWAVDTYLGGVRHEEAYIRL